MNRTGTLDRQSEPSTERQPAAASSEDDWQRSPEGSARALTPRQSEILALIGTGRSNKEIALALGIRERTVKFHIAALFERLGASSRTEALVVALRLRVIRLDEMR